METNNSDARELKKLYEGMSDFATLTPIEGEAGHSVIHPISNDDILNNIAKIKSGSDKNRNPQNLIDLLVKREYMKIMKMINGQRGDSAKVLLTAKNNVAEMLKQKGL